ncbi:MAG: PAS domain S-box protein [Paludibacter sp.]
METTNLKAEALLELVFCAENKNTEDEIINEVLHAYLRKLNCFMAGVLKKNNDLLLDKQLLPFTFRNDPTWQQIKDYIIVSDIDGKKGFFELVINDGYYYAYCLADYGYLVIGRKNPFDNVFKNEFRVVISLLGKMLVQSIEDERRKLAEKKLAEERQLLRTIIDNIPINIYTKDLEYRKTLANASELKHLGGLTEAEVIGKTDFDLYGESIGINTLKEDQKVLVDGIAILEEEKNVTNDRWALVSKIPLRDEKNNITGMVGISFDFTERKKTQEQLSLFLSLFDNISDAIQVNTEDGQLLYINKVAGERLGISQNEVQNHKVTDYLVIFPTEEAWKNHVKELKTKEFITTEGKNLNQKTGLEFPVEVTVKYVNINGNGYVVAISRDISERKKAEAELLNNEQKYRRITENMSDIVWTSDMQFNMSFLSPSVEKMIGESIDSHLKKSITEKFTPESVQKILSLFAHELEKDKDPNSDKKRTIKVEVEHYRADGSTFMAEINMSILRDDSGQPIGIQGETRDISERKKAENELRISEERKASLIASMSDIVFVLDNDLTLNEYFIPVNYKLFFDPERYFGKSFSRMPISKNAKMVIYKTLITCLNSGKFNKSQFYFELAQGKFWFDLHTTILKGQNGDNIGLTCVVRDITEQKKTEESLLYNETLLKGLFSLSPIGIALNDFSTGLFIDVNEALLKPTGYSKEEFLSLSYWDITPKEYLMKEMIQIDTMRNAGSYGPYEKEFIRKDGTKYPVQLKGTVVKDSLGRELIWNIVEDITDRKFAEETIKQQIKLQELLIKISSVYININLDKIQRTIQNSLKELAEFVHADRAYIFDYDLTANTASNIYEWCSEGVIPEINKLQNIPLKELPYFFGKHKKGEEFYVENVFALPNDGPNGIRAKLEPQGIKSLISLPMKSSEKLLGFVGFESMNEYHSYSDKEKKLLEVFSQMLVNVTERKRSETLLKLQEEKYRNIISNMNLGIIEVDKNEIINYANQSFCLMSGYSDEELIGMSTSAFLLAPDHESILKDKQQIRELGISDSYEMAVKNKKGEVRWWLISGAPNFNDNKELIGTIGIHLDITDQKKLERELESAKNSAEEAAKAKELFLANMSHEIRTPLNVILGMVRQLGKEKLNVKQSSFVNHSEIAAEHLLTIINNILDMSKIESGEFELDDKDFSVSSVVGNVRSILYSKASEKHLDFNIHISPEIKKSLIGDAGRLRQILINLLGNSLKFTEKGYVNLTVDVINSTNLSQSLKFTVNDSGIGMSQDFMKRLFDKFSQEEGSSNRRYEGTGLGMSIAKELIQLMGGEIEVSSQKGLGTQISFILNLPIGDETKLITKTKKTDNRSFSGLKILLVEDNDMNRFIAIQSLKHVGCEITEAINGLDAIEKVKKMKFDLILMDIQMPLLDGVETTKQIRGMYGTEIPIIALTANAFKHDIDLYLSVGMNDYLIKPYKENELLDKIAIHTETNNFDNDTIDSFENELFDLTQLKELSRNDETFILNMLNAFKNLANETIVQFDEALEKTDLEKVHKIAHKIKPSVENLQINLIIDKVRQLERYQLDDCNSHSELKLLINEVNLTLKRVVYSIESRI